MVKQTSLKREDGTTLPHSSLVVVAALHRRWLSVWPIGRNGQKRATCEPSGVDGRAWAPRPRGKRSACTSGVGTGRAGRPKFGYVSASKSRETRFSRCPIPRPCTTCSTSPLARRRPPRVRTRCTSSASCAQAARPSRSRDLNRVRAQVPCQGISAMG